MWLTYMLSWLSVKDVSLHNLGGPHLIRWRLDSFPEEEAILPVGCDFSWSPGVPAHPSCLLLVNLPGQLPQLCDPVPADSVSLVKPWLICLPHSVTARELPGRLWPGHEFCATSPRNENWSLSANYIIFSSFSLERRSEQPMFMAATYFHKNNLETTEC